MTKNIVLSDIDLVERLIKAERPDDEIVTALLKRGIETDKALRLVHDLRSGIRVEPELYAAPVLKEPRRVRSS